MKPPTLASARRIRDGGIKAMAALDTALGAVIDEFAPEDQLALKRAFGQAMGEISVGIIRPAVQAFPELEPDEATWVAIAKGQGASPGK